MDKIEIKGYKSFKELKLDLLPINILIGANGSGKSNFLSFFEFLNRLYEQKLTEYVALNGGMDKYFFRAARRRMPSKPLSVSRTTPTRLS